MAGEEENTERTFIGFDFSTQQIKAVVINQDLEVKAEAHVHFDSMLPEFRTQGGVHVAGTTVTAPTIMWVKGLDMLLDKLRLAGADFNSVAAISGCGQQHGSVYWRSGASEVLTSLQPDRFLHDQLASVFSISDSPVWMDSSTTEYCRQIEESLGGPETLTALTGSRAYERFTASQIAKIAAEKPDAFKYTERISLVSSFAASLFLGKVVGIDWADGGGMNLLNMTNKTWLSQILQVIGQNVGEKLGEPLDTCTVVGNISSYMHLRYGFPADCLVAAFTGDNCSSLAGLALGEADIGYSLGTSDTVFASLQEPNPQLTGHIFPNPVDSSAYMALLCYKNGSLAREGMRDQLAGGNWDTFNSLLGETPRGNFGNIGFYFDLPEIIPEGVEGSFRFNKAGEQVTRFLSEAAEVRALVEGQVMAKRIHAQNMGFNITPSTRILVTGGASVNSAILQVIADVFGTNVYSQTDANSAAAGGAYRALHLYLGGPSQVEFREVVQRLANRAVLGATPNRDAKEVYLPLLERFAKLEKEVVALCKKI